MKPVTDFGAGGVEDDASSTKCRSLLSLAGGLPAEISLPKLALSRTKLFVVGGEPGIISGHIERNLRLKAAW
jgi:hypothetical protein